MKFELIKLFILSLVIVSCNSSSKEKNEKEMHSEVSKSLSVNEKWMQAINTNDVNLLKTLYTKNAYVLSKLGVDLSNRKEILELVKNSDFKVGSVETTKRIKASPLYDYEIGNFTNKNGDLMKHIIIWNTSKGDQLRELEFLAEVENDSIDLNLIVMRRAEWMALCDAHDAKSLIKLMYTENTMYYNNGRLLKGRERLLEEYQYMNNPEYRLALEPILVEPVSNNIVYEIGQCKGSYKGKYILVWQKDNQGIWRILFDSNI